MWKRFVFCAAACLAVLARGAPVELHVATDGNNANPGTAAAPFASIWRARNEIRKLKERGRLPEGAVVVVHAGAYWLQAPLTLDAQDSGAANAPVVYRAAGDGEARLIAGVEVRGFKPYKGKILQADVSGLGLPDAPRRPGAAPKRKVSRFQGDVPLEELFFQGRRMPLARWPNRIDGDPHEGAWAYVPKTTEKTRSWFYFPNDRLKRWTRPQEAQVHIFPWYNYMDCYVGVKSVDAEKRVVRLAQPASYVIQPGRRFCVRNVFEELDAPGEWYLDRRKAVLYFWPPAPLDKGRVVLSRLDCAVRLDRVSYVTIQGFTIECAQGPGVRVQGGSHNLIAGCVIRNTFGHGAAVSGEDNRVVGCDIHDTGLCGVRLAGGDRKTLTPCRNVADNNRIWRPSRVVLTYTPAIHASGVGCRVSHNLIRDCPHMALGLGGNDHVFEFNDVGRAMLASSHGGAFYCGRDFTARGNVVRYNKLHDIYGYGFDHVDKARGVFVYSSPVRKLPGAFGIHLDDQISGFHIYGNVFYRFGHGVIRLGGGRDTVIENNIFADAGWAVHVDNRGMGWQRKSLRGGSLMRRLLAMPYQSPPWSTRYPKLVRIRDDRFGEPVDNVIQRNIFFQKDVLYDFRRVPSDRFTVDHNLVWRGGEPVVVKAYTYRPNRGGEMPFEEWRKLGFDQHSLVADPKFVDPAKDDYRLQKDSPAWKLGFKPIPFEKIGLYRSPLRASWPPPESAGSALKPATETYPIPGFKPPAAPARRK